MGHSNNQPSVLILQRRLVAYRVPLFERLRERLAAGGIRLEVAYGAASAAEAGRDDQGRLEFARPVPSWQSGSLIGEATLLRLPTGLLDRQRLVILPHENRFLANYAILRQRHRREFPKLAFWGHGRNFQSSPRGLRQRLGRWTGRQADWWFAYTELSAREIEDFGFPSEQITILNNAIDTREIQSWRESVHPSELSVLRQALGLAGQNVGIFLGSLTPPKRLEFLFRAADRVRQTCPDFELLLVGDGPERQEVLEAVRLRPWSRWAGARAGREKCLWLALGKVMLSPGMVGLHRLEGFAAGLPLLTTDCGLHSPEIAYLESGRNGVMTPDAVDAYAAKVAALLTDGARRETMGGHASKTRAGTPWRPWWTTSPGGSGRRCRQG